MGWLAAEAKQIHAVFSALFYSLVLTLILLGVIVGYFRIPMGQVPEFLQLVGRAVIAALLLAALPEIMNIAADLTDQLTAQIGGLTNFKLVVHRAGEKIGELRFSWVSVKDSVILLISYASFFVLYITVYLADTLFVFTWMLLYIFSPMLMAAFVLPSTASATRGFFQSLIEVCLWKVVWSVLAALLWSFALSKINDPAYGVDFLSAILLNVMLAFSVVTTPLIVRSLIKGGVHSAAGTLGGAILAVAAMTPSGLAGMAKGAATRAVVGFQAGLQGRGGEEKSEESPVGSSREK